jgi:hypothetical protein
MSGPYDVNPPKWWFECPVCGERRGLKRRAAYDRNVARGICGPCRNIRDMALAKGEKRERATQRLGQVSRIMEEKPKGQVL